MTTLITIDRLVHFVVPSGRHAGEVRPALCVQVFPGETVKANFEVFTDGSNDDDWLEPDERSRLELKGVERCREPSGPWPPR